MEKDKPASMELSDGRSPEKRLTANEAIEAIKLETGNQYDAVLVAAPGYVAGADSALPLEASGISSLATRLHREGFKVGILDADYCSLDREEIRNRLLSVTADFIGFTTFQNTMRNVLELAQKYKEKYSSSAICLGGYHATFTADEILSHEKYVDTVVVGKGDGVIGRLVSEAKMGQTDRGIVYGNKSPEPSDFQPRQLWQWRNAEVLRKNKAAALHTSSGCLCNCSFCSEPGFQNLCTPGTRSWKGRQVEDVIDEISYLNSEFGVEIFDFHDPDFLSLTKESWLRASALAQAIKKLPFRHRIRFTAQARAIVKTAEQDSNFWENWKQAGLERVFVGLEAGDDNVLHRFKKASRLHHNLAVPDILRKSGIALQIGYITFTPDTSEEELRESIAFLKQMGLAHHFRYLANELTVYPGTQEFNRLQAEGRLTYERSYLDVQFKYKHELIAQIAQAAKTAFYTQLSRLDELLWDIEFCLASGSEKMVSNSLSMDSKSARDLYEYLVTTRENSICRCFDEALSGDVEGAFERFIERDRLLFKKVCNI